jgi:rhodanese-related sulfurtransferase
MFNKPGVPEISPKEVAEKIKDNSAKVVDIREPQEYAEGYIDGITFIPMSQLGNRLGELGEKDAPLIMLCKSGGRSGNITAQLINMGYTNVTNMTGGMLAWMQNGLPTKS